MFNAPNFTKAWSFWAATALALANAAIGFIPALAPLVSAETLLLLNGVGATAVAILRSAAQTFPADA